MKWQQVFLTWLLLRVCASRQECLDATLCLDKTNNSKQLESLEEEKNQPGEIPAFVDSSSELPTTISLENDTTPTETTIPTTPPTTTTRATTPATTTVPTPTLPPEITAAQPTTVCWCDATAEQCDMNCCCDTECSIVQKQVFTHCSDASPHRDPNNCYSSNFLFRKPSNVKTTQHDSLFCVVRDNLSNMREFKARSPIRSVEEFEKLLRQRRRLQYTRHEIVQEEFLVQPYKGGSTVWSVQKGKLIPLEILSSMFGDLCLTTAPVKYLQGLTKTCSLRLPQQEPFCSQAVNDLLRKLLQVKIITSPLAINSSDMANSIENCSSLDACTTLELHHCKSSTKNCTKIDKLTSVTKAPNCQTFGLKLDFQFTHNGSEGILAAKAMIRTLNQSKLETSIKFLWSDAENTGFVRSGNPGYIRGRPILAGRKVVLQSNDTMMTKKEAIELTVGPEGWLTMLGSEKGKCSPANRQSLLFNVNVKRSCSFRMEKKFLSKNGCLEMQRAILKLLLDDDGANFTSASFNKFLGIYGNSKVEFMSDWVQVMVESFPLVSNQPSFENSSDGMSCKGLFTQLHVDIAIAKFGPFNNPQMKILGVLLRFGPPRDLFVRCIADSRRKSGKDRNIKLVTDVNFLDLTRPAVREFAQPPGLEAKLPYDFFYPFFAGKATSTTLNLPLAIISFCCALFHCV